MDQLTVSNNETASRFEVAEDGYVAFLSYTLRPDVIMLNQTEVPRELGGRGIANELAKAALEHARAKDLRVIPMCPFVARFIERNPEYKPLVRA
jgi:predicted GNAT family acetyltransferase